MKTMSLPRIDENVKTEDVRVPLISWSRATKGPRLQVGVLLLVAAAFVTFAFLSSSATVPGAAQYTTTYNFSVNVRPPPTMTRCNTFSMVTPGRWINGTYTPKFCRLPPRLSSRQIEKCLMKKHITRIGILSDSQGHRYEAAMKGILPAPHVTVRRERGSTSYMPGGSYYSSRNITGIKTHVRDCSGCLSYVSRHGKFTVDVVVSEFVMDTEVTLRDDRRPNDPSRTEQALTTQQFTAKYWWRPPYTPDLVLHLSTAVHDIARRTPSEYDRDLRWALDMWANTLPTNTTFITFNYHRINEADVPVKWRGVTRTEQLLLFNRIWRRAVGSLSSTLTIKQGLDLEEVSRTVDPGLYDDAIHLKPPWYRAILANIFFPVFCSAT